jgi:hypothetical protein
MTKLTSLLFLSASLLFSPVMGMEPAKDKLERIERERMDRERVAALANNPENTMALSKEAEQKGQWLFESRPRGTITEERFMAEFVFPLS